MTPARWPAVVVSVAAVVMAAASAFAPERMFPGWEAPCHDHPEYRGLRLFRDDYDRTSYATRGTWIRDGEKPHVDVYNEYPQLTTYMLAVPYLFVSDSRDYIRVFAFMMAVFLAGAAWVMAALCRRLGVPTTRVLYLLLPGTLYFSVNRFDIVPAGVAMGAALFLLGGRIALGHAVLAVGVLIKGYPVLYIPVFARVAWEAGGWRAVVRGWAAFAGFIGVCTLQLLAWVGLEPMLQPYRFQGNRFDNPESLFHVLSRAVPMAAESALRRAFVLLQAGLAPTALAAGRLSPRDVLRWLSAITIAFVVFSRFQSPQWVAWITPLAAVATVSRFERLLVVAQDVLTYLYFPLVYDATGRLSSDLAGVVGALTAVRLVLLLRFVLVRHATDQGSRS